MKQRIAMWLPAALLLTVLPGCPIMDWFKEQFGSQNPRAEKQQDTSSDQRQSAAHNNEGQAVVYSTEGVAVSQEQFQQHLDAMKESQPEMEQVLAFTPAEKQKEIYKQIADMMANQYVLVKYVENERLTETEEYQRNYRMLEDQMRKTLASQMFQNRIMQDVQQNISDSEARQYYEQNKVNMSYFQPDAFIKENGGVKASVLKADNQEQAQKIADQARQSDLKQAAREFDKSGAVQSETFNQQTTEPSREVVNKVIRMQNGDLPKVDTVGSYVVYASNVVNPTYADFENVKESIKNYMINESAQQYYSQKIQELRETYDVQTNTEAIDALVTPQQEAQSEQS